MYCRSFVQILSLVQRYFTLRLCTLPITCAFPRRFLGVTTESLHADRGTVRRSRVIGSSARSASGKASRGRVARERAQWQKFATRGSPCSARAQSRKTHATFRRRTADRGCGARHWRSWFPLLAFAATKRSRVHRAGEVANRHCRRTRIVGSGAQGQSPGGTERDRFDRIAAPGPETTE